MPHEDRKTSSPRGERDGVRGLYARSDESEFRRSGDVMPPFFAVNS
jgi:hypothetical protein